MVQKGDTLWRLSRHYKLDIHYLARLNHLKGERCHFLAIGQRLRLQGQSIDPPCDLKVRILDAAFSPVAYAHLVLFADNQCLEFFADEDGCAGPFRINQLSLGVRIDFKNIAEQWETVAQINLLPEGLSTLTVQSGAVLVKVQAAQVTGRGSNTPKAVDDHLQRVSEKNITAQVTANPKLITQSVKGKTLEPWQPEQIQTREAGGIKTLTLVPMHAKDGLKLCPSNELYREPIVVAAKKNQVPAVFLAALIEVESHKLTVLGSSSVRDAKLKPVAYSQWCHGNRDSLSTQAVGLCQFQMAAWLDVAVSPKTLLNAKLCAELRTQGLYYDTPKSLAYKKYSKILFDQQQRELHPKLYLPYRLNTEIAIDAAAYYVKTRLQQCIQDQTWKKWYERLNEREQMMLMYACFNLGPVGVKHRLVNVWSDFQASHYFNIKDLTEQQRLSAFILNIKGELKSLLGVTWPARFMPERFMVNPSNFPENNWVVLLKKLHQFNQSHVSDKPYGYYRSVDSLAQSQKNKNSDVQTPSKTVTEHFSAVTKSQEKEKHAEKLKLTESPKIEEQPKFAENLTHQQSTTEKRNIVSEKKQHRLGKPRPVSAVEMQINNPQRSWPKPLYHAPLQSLEIRSLSPGGQSIHPVKCAFGPFRVESTMKGRAHYGIDLACEKNQPIYSMFDGQIVKQAYEASGFGHYIQIYHEQKDLPDIAKQYIELLGLKGFSLLYAHTEPNIKNGIHHKEKIFVKSGEIIGFTGCSGNASAMINKSDGCHLHLETRAGWQSGTTAIDPLPLFPLLAIDNVCVIHKHNHLWDSIAFPRSFCKTPACRWCPKLKDRFPIKPPIKAWRFFANYPLS